MTIAPVGVGNALTLPAQRHLVRMDPGGGAPVWLLALQQDGTQGHGLAFFRSDDGSQSYQYLADIQPDWTERDTADLLPVGNDVALTYSYEGPTLSGSSRHDVYFQWWRYQASGRTWAPSPPVKVFDSTSDATAYSRAEIARDSKGRIWIQAFRLETDGSSSAAIAVSTDGGSTFQQLADLDHLSNRGGGRLLWLGDRVVFVYAMHDGFQGTHFRIHVDADAPDVWQPVTLAFPEGIYHGAALSAVASPTGGMHLVYKDENDQCLYYRYFDGTSFGPRTQLDDSNDWALQPAITLVGSQLYVFYNHMYSSTDYEFRYRVLSQGSFSPPIALDSQANFKGYPTAVDALPTSSSAVPAFFSACPTAADSGELIEVFAQASPQPSVDGGAPAPDAGSTVPDAGSIQPTGVLFQDAFNRTASDAAALGSSWTTTGLWYTQNEAISDLDGADLALEHLVACADCSVSATLDGFGVPHLGLVIRATGGARYQLDLLGSGHLQLQRVSNGATTVLADAPSGLADLSAGARLTLAVSGSNPVTLTGSVNGSVVLTAEDGSSAALGAAGEAGLFTSNAGVWFDDFEVDGLASTGGAADGGPIDAGLPDAGPIDAGTPDSGFVDAGPVDAGVPDAGPVDAGVPDAGPVDAGVPDAGSSGILFQDAFSRSGGDAAALGASWLTQGLWYTSQRAITDLDGTDLAWEQVAACADCAVSATVTSFGVPHAAIFLRASADGSARYQLDLLASGHLQLQRVSGGSIAVLADAASGVADLSQPVKLSLSAQGSSPVMFTASVNGQAVFTAMDSSSAALTGAGYAGLYSTSAGVPFDDFVLSGLGVAPPPNDGGIDAGGVDAGAPDAGAVDAGPMDAGGPDAGTLDAGVPDAGFVDAGAPDAGPSGGTAVLFQDAFNRSSTDSQALGASWTTSGLWYTSQEAISDLDGADLAAENQVACADCQVSATLDGFGVPEIALFLRAPTPAGQSRYQLELRADGHVQIQRVDGSGTTVLADVPSGLVDLSAPAQLRLSATGSSPVTLTASVNGVPVASASDLSTAALAGPGYAGLFTTSAGVWWDDFTLRGTGASAPASPDAGATDAGTSNSSTLGLSVTYTDTTHKILAMDPAGTAYAIEVAGGSQVFASTDGRSWALRGAIPNAYFFQMTALADGTLLADVISGGTHHLARSSDHGATWTLVLDLGAYRTLTPQSWAQLDGEIFVIEYQDFTTADTTLRLWVSDDDGQTWSVRHTFTGHRHGHGLAADPAHHALWVFFGDTDAQSGIYRSTDAGQSFALILGNQPGDVVDAAVLPDGSLLFGQDISYLPPTPHVATLSPSGAYQEWASITGPSYAIHALRGGGYVLGAEREPGGDIYPSGEVSAHVYVSADGQSWSRALDYPRLDPGQNARADVYWQLPSGELLLQLENAQGFGATGVGYQLLRVSR